MEIEKISEAVQEKSQFVAPLLSRVNETIVGQESMVNTLLLGLLADGHILLEGAPGLAKTLAIKSLAEAVEADFSRIQFTPDLLPSDVVGTLIYNIKSGEFETKKGPIFSNFVLADEINRAPAKVQSALLEAMAEKQVTIGQETFSLEKPFLVLATQNPIDQEGTYSLPEAQMDRFMFKTIVDFPNKQEERDILRGEKLRRSGTQKQPVVTVQEIMDARGVIDSIYLDEKIEQYIIDIVFATRRPEDYRLEKLKPLISFGVSPRGSLSLYKGAKTVAFTKGRGFVIPEDIRLIAKEVLRHRIGTTFEAEAEGITTDDIVHRILNNVKIP